MVETAQINLKKKKETAKIVKLLKPRLFEAIVPALITGIFTYIAAVNTSNKAIINLRAELQQQIINSLIQEQTQTNINNPNSILGDSGENNKSVSQISSFNSEDWIFSISKGMTPNKEGYFCSPDPAFPSWAMWTKKKYKAEEEISITISLLDGDDKDKQNPTFYLSYGDKTNDVPDSFYRFNLFDGDLNTLRLYGRDNKEILFERSKSEAPLDKFITFTLSPVFPNKKSSTLILNPSVIGQEYDFQPDNKFEIELPLSSSENQGDGFQYGLGVSRGDCFKIISSKL